MPLWLRTCREKGTEGATPKAKPRQRHRLGVLRATAATKAARDARRGQSRIPECTKCKRNDKVRARNNAEGYWFCARCKNAKGNKGRGFIAPTT